MAQQRELLPQPSADTVPKPYNARYPLFVEPPTPASVILGAAHHEATGGSPLSTARIPAVGHEHQAFAREALDYARAEGQAVELVDIDPMSVITMLRAIDNHGALAIRLRAISQRRVAVAHWQLFDVLDDAMHPSGSIDACSYKIAKLSLRRMMKVDSDLFERKAADMALQSVQSRVAAVKSMSLAA